MKREIEKIINKMTWDDTEEIAVNAIRETDRSEAGFLVLFGVLFVLLLLISILLSQL